MDSNHSPTITAETAALASKAIDESGIKLAEISRQTLIPYATLHRKINGAADLSVREIAALSTALSKPFLDLIPPRLHRGN